MVKITVWTDYACPFCYIAEARIDNLVKETGVQDQVEFDYHSFEFYPDAPQDVQETTVVRFATKYGLTEQEAKKQIDDIAKLGRAEGLNFNYRSTLNNTNSLDAHRLTQYVNSLGDAALTKRVSDLLFDAYFGQNLKLADHAVLLGVAQEAGLDMAKVKEVLDSNAFYDEVRADENFIMNHGVNAVPFFIIDNKGIMGAQPKNLFRQVITEALQKDMNSK